MSAIQHGASLAGRDVRGSLRRTIQTIYHGAIHVGCAMALASLCTGLLSAGATAVRAEPLVTLVRGVEPDGSDALGQELAVLWHASTAYDGSSLGLQRLADPRARLRALRTGRASFAILDAGAFAELRPEFPDVAVLSALMPLTVHALMRGAESGPLNRVPGTIVFTAGARSIAQALAQSTVPPAGASASTTVQAPLLRPMDPFTALDLLRRGAPDTLVLIAAPYGTADIAKLLGDETSVRLVSLAPGLMDALRSDRRWVLSATVQKGAYPNQTETVQTPAVHLLMLTMPYLPQDDARRMLDCLYLRREQVAGTTNLFAAVDRRANSDYAKWAPYHPTALKEFGLTQ